MRFTPVAPACLLTSAALAQEPLWTVQMGTGGIDEGVAVLALPDGAYFAGTTGGSLAGPSAGSVDAFLVKVGAAGSVQWSIQFGAAGADRARGLAPAGFGGVFIAGTMSDGPTGMMDIFLARYDATGQRLWFRRLERPDNDEIGWIAEDGAGGFFLGGSVTGSFAGPSAGSLDVFLARYDEQGQQRWARQIGTAAYDLASSVSPDGAGGAYVAGSTQGPLGGPYIGGDDILLVRFDAEGNQLWARQLGTTHQDRALGVAAAPGGGAYVCGLTMGRLTPGPLVGTDAFLAHFDDAGTLAWVRQLGTNLTDTARSVAPLPGGGALMVGTTVGALQPPSFGQSDAFAAAYSAQGDPIAVNQWGTPFDDEAYAVSAGGAGVYCAGGTGGSLGGPQAGALDAFVSRLSSPTCYPNCDSSTQAPTLNVLDFTCFLQRYAAGESYANCDNSTIPPFLNIADFTCFLQRYAAGCN